MVPNALSTDWMVFALSVYFNKSWRYGSIVTRAGNINITRIICCDAARIDSHDNPSCFSK